LTTGHEFLTENPTTPNKIETLEDLITNFKKISETENIKEREFFVYNGKLKMGAEGQEMEKSIEIKISFVQHFKNEYIILILRDTTQRDLLITLEDTNKYKDRLLASVSHELRTPLNGNINLVESSVNSKKVPEMIKETLLIPALRSSKFLLHLINDILDMSQIREKKLRLAYEIENLRETIKSTAQLVELQASKKGINLVMELDPELPKKFRTDHIRLSQIILNLLNNAIKFTKEGTVKLTAALREDNSVKICVEDSGIGMTEENVKKLFSNYTHIEFEERQKMNPTGVGLGLNIAYNLAELLAPEGHQGIVVESILNKGSTFTFVIENKEEAPMPMLVEDGELSNLDDSSCQKVDDERPGVIYPKILPKIQRTNMSTSAASLVVGKRMESESFLVETSMCSCPKILVVDDNPFNMMAFETIVTSLGIKCESVYSGSSAIKKLLNRENERCDKEDCKKYSIAFLDQEMPEMNGSEVALEIRRLQKENLVSPLVKIIGCTAHQSKEEIERFLAAGLDGCIQKPISPLQIKEVLNQYLL